MRRMVPCVRTKELRRVSLRFVTMRIPSQGIITRDTVSVVLSVGHHSAITFAGTVDVSMVTSSGSP